MNQIENDERRIMIIDIGSNTVKYDVFSLDGRGDFQKIAHRSRVLGFIAHIDENGEVLPSGINGLSRLINEYKKDGEALGCADVAAFATASFRRCADPFGVIEKIYENTAIRPELISGKEEAALSLAGVLSTDRETTEGIMADMGGGSTEINIYKDRKSVYSVSNPFGALSLKRGFVKDKGGDLGGFADGGELRSIYAHALETVKNAGIPKPFNEEMYIVGGSARAIGALVKYHFGFHPENEGFSPDELRGILEIYANMTEEKCGTLKMLTPEREYLILPAIAAFKAISDHLGVKNIKVALGGIKDGYLVERYINNSSK